MLLEIEELSPKEIADLIKEFGLESESELNEYLTLISEVNRSGTFEAVEEYMPPRYREVPVSMEMFLEDSYFLGETSKTLYPIVKNGLIELFSNPAYWEAVLKGAIGWGKSTFAEIGLIRSIYEISCLSNPYEAYGLIPGTGIFFGNFSVNFQQAKHVVFGAVKAMLRNSPYFQECFPYTETKTQIEFPNQISMIAMASTDNAALGLNLFGGIIDETNFMQEIEKSKKARGEKTTYEHAQSLYTTMIRRMESRFMKQGKLPGCLFMVSSEVYPEDFTNKKAIEAQTNPHIFVMSKAQWETKPADTYSGKKFRVAIGTERTRSKILADGERPSDPEAEVIEVPVEFQHDFEKDIEASLRDIAGKSTITIEPFITRREAIKHSVKLKRFHPYKEIETELQNADAWIYENFLVKDEKRGRMVPKFNPRKKRHAHADLAYAEDGDFAGLAVGHVARWVEVTRRDNKDQKKVIVKAPVIFIDLLLRIKPPLGEEIFISDVADLLVDMSQWFSFGTISYDSFQSKQSLQWLERRGYETELVGGTKLYEGYMEFKRALYENRFNVYDYPPYWEEVPRLMLDKKKKKVDHPPGGYNDVSDAIAGVVYHCMNEEPMEPIAPSLGKMEEPADREKKRIKEKLGGDKAPMDALDRMFAAVEKK